MTRRIPVHAAYWGGALLLSMHAAAADPNWYEVQTQSAPPVRESSPLAFDAGWGRMVLFSGTSSTAPGDQWEYAGRVWSRREPGIRPTAREYHALVYDSARGKVILYGGAGTTGKLGDLWEWTGFDWLARTPGGSPPTRSEHALADDPVRGRVVLFGGSGSLSLLSDTWEWNGVAGTWTQRSPVTSPAPRREHAMAYDPISGRVILFGGYNGSTVISDTWAWDGNTGAWTQLFPATIPAARLWHAMALDPASGRIVLFGGRDAGNTNFADTWEWDGANWIQRFPAVSPAARYAHGLAFDSNRNRLVLTGGSTSSSNSLNDTWEWNGTNWSPAAVAPPRPSRRTRVSLTYDAANQRTVQFGGNNLASGTDLGDTWTWDGSSWTQMTPASAPPARTEHAATYDSARSRVLIFGGYQSGILHADTWEWNGSNWLNRTPAASPPARRSAAMAYDSLRNRTVLFGGNRNSSTFADTWEWNGTTGLWTQFVPITSPPASSGHAMAYDPIRSRTVLLNTGGTWEWDGTNWTQRPASPRPSSSEALMTWDDASGTIVVLTVSGQLWDWNGTGWSQRNPANSPPPQSFRGGMAYDIDRARLVAFGGSISTGTSNNDATWEFGEIPACSSATRVVSYAPGAGASGTGADPEAARGLPDGQTVSLGLSGSIVVELDPPMADGQGVELSIVEKGAHAGEINENYRVDASVDGVTFALAAVCTGGQCPVDLGASGLAAARYLRITDLVPQEAGSASPTMGADIDAILARDCDAAERCDGLDDDADGVVDEGCDDDGDGWCDARWGVVGSPPVCPLGDGDCDDGVAAVHPGGAQICDGYNNDCEAAGWPSTAGTHESDDDGDSYAECQGDCNDGSAVVHPGATDVCNRVDDDCDGLVDDDPLDPDGDADGVRNQCDNCLSAFNQSQGDADSDGEGDVCDLDDGLILLFSTDRDNVRWQQEAGPEAFHVYEGDLAVLRATGTYTQEPGSNALAERTCAVTDVFLADPGSPPAGAVKFALVTGVEGGVEGSLGRNSAGVERPNSNPCP